MIEQLPGGAVTIVCSDQARNGKTLMAAFLGDYLIHEGRDVCLFDLDSPGGELASRFNGRTKVIDLSQTRGIMDLFDTIMASPARDYVLDVPHHLLDRFFSTLAEIDVVGAAHKNGVQTNVLFFCDPSIASIAHARKIKRQLIDGCFIIVRNEAVSALNPDSVLVAAYKELCRPGYFVLPRMSRDTRECLASGSWSFAGFLEGKNLRKLREKHYTTYVFFNFLVQEFERLQFRLDLDRWKSHGIAADNREWTP